MTSLCRAIVTTAVAALLAASAITPAVAGPIVLSGSTYSFRVSGTGFGGFTLNNVVFDGLSEVRVIDGRTVTMTEDQQDLGNGQWKVSLTLTSDIDMAPDNTIAFSFGHEDALDLMQTVSLQSLRLMVGGFDGQGRPVATDNEVLQLLSPSYRSPWLGAVADPPSTSIALVGIINWDVRSASYEMIVRNVPEPPLPALIGSALAALAWTRRRRSQPRRA